MNCHPKNVKTLFKFIKLTNIFFVENVANTIKKISLTKIQTPKNKASKSSYMFCFVYFQQKKQQSCRRKKLISKSQFWNVLDFFCWWTNLSPDSFGLPWKTKIN